jgi:hypothetical protein
MQKIYIENSRWNISFRYAIIVQWILGRSGGNVSWICWDAGVLGCFMWSYHGSLIYWILPFISSISD